MDELKFNIRSLSSTSRVGGKSNELDAKEKEKSYEKPFQKKNKEQVPKSDDFGNPADDFEDEQVPKRVVDVFI
ncbi:MAG: hypothetical protein FP816_10505 [Desulfobacteraceae bacterium]|nr:hypothetical protein [Desulfobacteraceae bacterium]MBU4001714.1 hypothetical protein [Pseudomonadota bacterium]MBU4054041.1 hypothetical protein [Pseudomonadota bacterium]